MSGGPIFITGVSYSGKTQLRLMLNTHANIHITRRTYFWRKVANAYGDLSRDENLEHCLAALFSSKPVQALNVDQESVRREFAAGEKSYGRLFTIIHQQHVKSLGKSRWGVQQSFVESEADLIISQMPDARILHVIRSPFDRVTESLAVSSRCPGKVGWETALWKLSARWAARNIQRYPQHYRLVYWEAMLAEPARVLSEVCDFLGEAYDFVGVSSEYPRAAEHNGQYRLSAAEQAFIQRWAGPEMEALGYPVTLQRLAPIDRLSLALLDYPINSAGAAISGILRQKKWKANKARMEMRTA